MVEHMETKIKEKNVGYFIGESEFQELICAVSDSKTKTICGITDIQISDATIFLSEEFKVDKKTQKPTDILLFSLEFKDYLLNKSVEGDKELGGRPAVTMNAQALFDGLEAGKDFGSLFVNYIQENEASNCAQFNKKAKEDTSKAQLIVGLFMYDYAIYKSARDYQDKGKNWYELTTEIAKAMKRPLQTVVANLFNMKNMIENSYEVSEARFDLIALQESNNVQALAQVPSGEFRILSSGDLSKRDSKSDASMIIYNSAKFEIAVENAAEQMKTVQFEKKDGSLKILEEYVCAVFQVKEVIGQIQKGEEICMCSVHADSDGMMTEDIVKAFKHDCNNYQYAILAMDGNVFDDDNKDAGVGKGKYSFGQLIEIAGDLEINANKDLQGKPLQMNTTNKTRTYTQVQIKKAGDKDQNPKDHIITKGLSGSRNRCNTYFEQSGDEPKICSWDDSKEMPNDTFGADHAVVIFEVTDFNAVNFSESQSITPHIDVYTADRASADSQLVK